jgi:GNAT superfamily N-acetyltransferase
LPGVDVRVATVEDLPAIVAAFGQESYFARQVPSDERDLLVAWHDGAPVGDVVLIRAGIPEPEIRDGLPGVAQISHLEVAEAHQRRGVGTALVGAAERLAYEHGHATVSLGCGVTNTARALYDALGYEDWGHGTVEFRWDDPEPDSERCHVLIKFTDPSVPPLASWQAWHPREVAQVLAGCPVPWMVAGGWAIDLHLGRQTRPHDDVEVALPRHRFVDLRPYLTGFDLYDVSSGTVRRLRPDELPDPEHRQVWVGEAGVPAWRLDLFLEPGDERTWVSHRDTRVTLPMEQARRIGEDGVPYLAAEAVLFAKAKHTRDKDAADLDHTLPTLDAGARTWLADALRLAHPDHAWLARVSG